MLYLRDLGVKKVDQEIKRIERVQLMIKSATLYVHTGLVV